MHKFVRSILNTRGIRSDAVWTHDWVYGSPLRHIPLYLDVYALLKSQYWPRAEIYQLQEEKLRTLFTHARRIPFWRERLEALSTHAGSVYELLAQLPVASKRDLSERRYADIADTSLLPTCGADHTSGSTGKPFHFYHDRYSMLRSCAITERIFRTATGTRYPVVYMRSRERYGFTFYRHDWFFVRNFRSIKDRLKEFQTLAARYPQGFVLYGYTSWVRELARCLDEAGAQVPIKAVMVAGEHLVLGDKKEIERIMGAEVFELYASREVGYLGFQCAERKLHVSEEWALVEILDAEGKSVPVGTEGRVIVTTFDSRVMPFIRYDIGDIGALSDAPCACGRTLRTLTFKGRTSELLNVIDRTVSLLDVAHALSTYHNALAQYQIVQESDDRFVIRVIPGSAYELWRTDLHSLMQRMLHPDAHIIFEEVDEIAQAPSGKAEYFVRRSAE